MNTPPHEFCQAAQGAAYEVKEDTTIHRNQATKPFIYPIVYTRRIYSRNISLEESNPWAFFFRDWVLLVFRLLDFGVLFCCAFSREKGDQASLFLSIRLHFGTHLPLLSFNRARLCASEHDAPTTSILLFFSLTFLGTGTWSTLLLSQIRPVASSLDRSARYQVPTPWDPLGFDLLKLFSSKFGLEYCPTLTLVSRLVAV